MPKRGGVDTLIDGAHNVDKIHALLTDLKTLLPAARTSPPVVLFGALDTKDTEAMLSALVPEAHGFVATTAPVMGKSSLSAEALAHTARRVGASGTVIAETDVTKALRMARDLAKEQRAPLLVTGSMYLAGAVRAWWYPDIAVLTRRTPWPAVSAEYDPPADAW